MKILFKILFSLSVIFWPLGLMAKVELPEDVKIRLEQAEGKDKLQVWKEWYRPYFYEHSKLWESNLDQACATAANVLPEEEAIKWCMDLHLELSEKYILIGHLKRSINTINKAKALRDQVADNSNLYPVLLKMWLIGKGTHQFLQYEKVDSSTYYFDRALAINAGEEEARLNFRLYKAGLEMYLAAGNYQNAGRLLNKLKENQWSPSESEQLELDFLALSLKNNVGLEEVTEQDYLSLLAASVAKDSVLELKIKLDLAAHLYFTNQFEKAESLLVELDEVLKSFNIFQLRELLFNTHARVLNKLGRHEEARVQIDHYRHALLKESEKETNQIIKEQTAAFKTNQKKEQILKAQKERALREASYIKKMAYLIGIGTFPIGLLLFFFIKNKNRRKELGLLKERNQAINNDRNRLFSSITADIKTPLAMMMAPMERAAKSIGHPEAIADIQLAQRNGERLMELFDQIQDWKNLEARVLKVNLSKGDLLEKLKQIAQRFSAQAENKALLFETNLQIEDTYYEMDFEKVNRVIANLLSNAVKFCEPSQKITFLAEEVEQGRYLKFTIRDNGPGITEEDQTHLFDRHFQGKEGQMKGGTGIGLATVKEMVDLMQGRLSFDSAIGKGTSFYVEIPAKKTKAVATETKVPKLNSEQAIVLLVEDERELLGFLKSELSKTYEILTADNTKDGLALAKQHIPDLVVSDWNLPDQTGGWLCQQILQNQLTHHIPVMILTGLSNPDHLKEVFDVGAIARMEKPFKLDALRSQIKNILLQQQKIKIQWTQDEIESVPKENPSLSFIEQIRQIITQNLSDEYFSVEKMAEILMISRVQLFRKLKNTTGKSPSQLLKEARLEKSRILLQDTDQSIAEIAYAVGYSDPNNFSTAYKKHFKAPPSDERNR